VEEETEQNCTIRIRVLLFVTNPLVSFDNNLAERDIRMSKLKMRISGLSRSENVALGFSRIRIYISKRQKNNISIIDGLTKATNEESWIPEHSKVTQSIPVSSSPELAVV
jgi:hypothetical protein